MQTQSKSDLSTSIRDYALALLIFAVAVGARYLLDFVVPERLPFITFFPAVLVAAYFCGTGPSILVLILWVTGIPPTEAQALATRGEDYRRYQRTTSPFVPWFPREAGS